LIQPGGDVSAYVDELMSYGQRARPGPARNFFGEGRPSCHLGADSDEELHAFAERLGLRREWAQDDRGNRAIHYDLTPARRTLAVRLGAIEMSTLDQCNAEVGIFRRNTAPNGL
jgi:hypothetical protein